MVYPMDVTCKLNAHVNSERQGKRMMSGKLLFDTADGFSPNIFLSPRSQFLL
jgi:hypothetical protein